MSVRASHRMLYALMVVATSSLACGESPTIGDTTRLGDTFDRDGPYVVRTVITSPGSVESATLVVSTAAGGESRFNMGEVREGIFQASIPGQPAFTRVRYHIEVDDGDVVISDPPSARQGQEFFGFWVLGAECSGDGDCLTGEFCDSSKVCRQASGPCAEDVDCGRGLRCADGRCRLSARACSSDAGCAVGEVCDVLLGECVPRPSCPAGAECPLDFVCEDEVCRRQCAGDGDCFGAERCDVKGICRAEFAACNKPQDCAQGLVCDLILRICRNQGAAPCGGCGVDLDCGGANDHCLVVGGQLRCGKDCSLSGCAPGYRCDSSHALPQCVPDSGSCVP